MYKPPSNIANLKTAHKVLKETLRGGNTVTIFEIAEAMIGLETLITEAELEAARLNGEPVMTVSLPDELFEDLAKQRDH